MELDPETHLSAFPVPRNEPLLLELAALDWANRVEATTPMRIPVHLLSIGQPRMGKQATTAQGDAGGTNFPSFYE